MRGGEFGINAHVGTTLLLSNSVIEDASLYGLLMFRNSKLYVSGTAFNGNDIGLSLSSQTDSWVKALVEGCTFTDNTDGIWIEDVGDSVVVIDDSAITNSTTTGIYVEDLGDVRITGNTITDGTIGIYSYESSPQIRSRNLIQANAVGIKSDHNSSAVVESCTVTNNTTGVAVINGSNPDLGHTSGGSSLGRNILNLNTSYFVSNLTSNTVSAENEFWGGGVSPCYPKASKIYGPVDYDPALCSAPPLASVAYPLPSGESKTQTLPKTYGLGENYPNPFNPTTTVAYQVPAAGGSVDISVFDVGGRLIATLVKEEKAPGYYTVSWQGHDRRGRPVASGVYFLRMQAGPFAQTRKLVLLK